MGKGVDYKGYVYVRGSHRNKGAPVASRNLTALGSEGGDRLALAKDLVEKDNPPGIQGDGQPDLALYVRQGNRSDHG